MIAKSPTAAQVRALTAAVADPAGQVVTVDQSGKRVVAHSTVRALRARGWVWATGSSLLLTDAGRQAVAETAPVAEVDAEKIVACMVCPARFATVADSIGHDHMTPAEEAPAAEVTEGATVEVVAGFAANMTGPVEAVEVTETFGRRVLVALPGFGPRWLTEDFVRLVA